MPPCSQEDDRIQRLEEDLEWLTLVSTLTTERPREDDDPKGSLDRKSMSMNPFERKATRDNPKDKNVDTTVVDSWPRPDIEDPISPTAQEEIFSLLPPTVWVVTLTRVSHDTLRTLCLCTAFSTAKAVLSHLADQFSSHPFLYVPQGSDVLITYLAPGSYGSSKECENTIGFEALMTETGGVIYHVKARKGGGKAWQGHIQDRKVFGLGFMEVTQENVRRVLRV